MHPLRRHRAQVSVADDPLHLVRWDREAGSVTLACPRCGNEDLATIEQLVGLAYCKVVERDGKRQIVPAGHTEVNWSGSRTVGIGCRICGWETLPDIAQRNDTSEWLRLLARPEGGEA